MTTLDTPVERVKLLKAGLNGREIEQVWMEQSNKKLLNVPILKELT